MSPEKLRRSQGGAPWMRELGAVALLVGGALHVRLASDAYGTDDLITLFLLNGVGSSLVAAWIVYDRRPFPLLAGLSLSAVSLLAFTLSRVGDGVVGFRGIGLEPSPDSALTIAAEGIAALLLSGALIRSRDELSATVRQLRARATRA